MCPDRVSGMEIKRKNNHFVTAQLVEVEFKVHEHRCAFLFYTKYRVLKDYENIFRLKKISYF